MNEEWKRSMFDMYLAGVQVRTKVHPAWIKELRDAFYAGFSAAKLAPDGEVGK